jgi:PhoPQ-activated pathogenicity-related protein
MDVSRGYISSTHSDIWTHQVVVIVPNNLLYTNYSSIWLTGDSNKNYDNNIKRTNYDILVGDALAHNTRAISVVVK